MALGASEFVVDLEGDMYRGAPDRVEQFMDELRALIGFGDATTPSPRAITLSSHRYPSLHGDVPIEAAMRFCDWGDPQMYYVPAPIDRNVGRAIDEWRAFGKPLAATMAAFPEGTGDPSTIPFVADACLRRGVRTLRWWSWEHASTAMWDEIRRVCAVARSAIDGGGAA
jgi:hypothetical protein